MTKTSSYDLVQFGVIGGGVMGEALLSRLIANDVYRPTEILVSDPQDQRREFLQRQYGVQVTNDNQTVFKVCPTVLLAIKPQSLPSMQAALEHPLNDFQDSQADAEPNPLLISIMAGVPLEKLETVFPGQSVVRAMPNTPATVGAGITAIAAGTLATDEHLKQARQIFQAVGQVVQVPESLMDAVTGLSGSGPGYVAIVIEALTDGGVAAGLPRNIAEKLALQTVLGTAQLLQEAGLHPAELKDRVTSPGGTTIAGITQLERQHLRAALIDAVVAARDRAQQLGS